MFTLFKGEKGVGESLKVGFVLSVDYHSLVGRNLLHDAFGDLPSAAFTGGGHLLNGKQAEEENEIAPEGAHVASPTLGRCGNEENLGGCSWLR